MKVLTMPCSPPSSLGLFASAFDPLHPGYIWAMQQALDAGVCTGVIAALHIDPSVERDYKPSPVLTCEERRVLLSALKPVVQIVEYLTEAELYDLLKALRPAVRILGEDYKGRSYTGDDLGITVFYAQRRSDWSGEAFRERMCRLDRTLINNPIQQGERT